MKFINRISIWYPPLLAMILYGIYVVGTNFSSPESFSWIFLAKSILQFYAYLFFIASIDDFLQKKGFGDGKKQTFLNFIIAYVISLVFGIILYVIVKQSFIIIYGQHDQIGFYHLLITSLSITVGYVLMFSIYQVVKSNQQQLKSELKESEYQKEKLRLQYELLYNKLEPHFLFNNLNTLHSLIVEKKSEAEEFVMSLSRVMRYSFQSQAEDSVSLEEELEIFDHYIRILKERTGGGLSYEVINKPDDGHKRIIPMTLLNLLENVTKHNEIGPEMPVGISINLSADCMEVTNNINPRLIDQTERSGGLGTITEMYRIRTGKPVTFHKEDKMFSVKIPWVVS